VRDRWRARCDRVKDDRVHEHDPAQGAPFDPPAYGLGKTAGRLADVWREQRRLSLVGLVYAFLYSVLSLAIPLLIAVTIDDSIVDHRYPLAPLLVGIGVLSVIRGWVNFRRRYATSRVGIQIEARLRELLYEAYLRYPRAFYDRQPTGQVLSRATNDLYPVRYFIGWGMVQAVQSSMLIVGTGVLLAVTNWQLALWSALPMPMIAVVAWRFGSSVAPVSRAVQARKGDLTDAANEAVVGIEMVQAFGRGQIVRDRFADRAATIRTEMLRQARLESIYLPPIFYLPSLSVALVLFLGGRSVIHGTMSYGDLALFIQLLLQLVWPLESIGLILDLSQRALAAAGRAFSWLDQIPVLAELPPARATRRPREQPAIVGFGEVHFAYSDGPEVLRGVRLWVEPGEVVAVCGRTGAGKSTLLSLVPRLYDPSRGAVTLSGIDLRAMTLDDVRSSVTVVTQRPLLFTETLRENLVAGRRDITGAEIELACRRAGVWAFLDLLPDGLDTLIGERGINLSGGQRQRVTLARALLSPAPVAILDDPLSAVDTEAEREIVEGLRLGLAGRAVLLATQRLSTLALADRIVVLEGGQIVEHGELGQLLDDGGAFTELFGEEAVTGAG
jgi:ABC-type multidrug transport system fused ATPase/permease subunit